MSRKVCVVTGTRAEFGLLRMVMEKIEAEPSLQLQILATGMHLSNEFGLTYREIEDAGFAIDAKVEMLVSADSATAVTKSMGLGLIGFADVYQKLSPDLVVVLGDRYEVFAAASAALIAGIPLAHLHGGEVTEGAFDEALRHSITKMSHLHFVAADEYRRRVIQLGEDPSRVFLVGGLGVDAVKQVSLLPREELEESLGFKLGKKNLLVTFHPATLELQSTEHQMNELLMALEELKDTHIVFTMPNADNNGRKLAGMVSRFVAGHPKARAYTSLGQVRYLSCMKLVDGVVGNSSSGLAEAPSLGVASINIGDRQKGRLSASSVIDCAADSSEIQKALCQLYEKDFRTSLADTVNPYGSGGASQKIVDIISGYPLDEDTLKKSFFDVPVTN